MIKNARMDNEPEKVETKVKKPEPKKEIKPEKVETPKKGKK